MVDAQKEALEAYKKLTANMPAPTAMPQMGLSDDPLPEPPLHLPYYQHRASTPDGIQTDLHRQSSPQSKK